MRTFISRILLLAPVLFLSLHCGDVKTAATGKDDEILVFADDSTWTFLEPTVRDVFIDTVLTPQPEPWFTLRRIPFDEFSTYETSKNRIVIAPLNGTGLVTEFVSQSLEPRVKEFVLSGEQFVFNKYDSKARGQILMFLTGINLAALESAMRNNETDLRYFFKNMSMKRELAGFESEKRYEKRDIEQRTLNKYGWLMMIQHDYFVAIDSSESRFFWIRRATPSDMERWVFVHWLDAPDPTILTDRYAIELRNAITRRFLRTVDNEANMEIAPYNLEVQNVDFLGRFAYELRGNWRFSDKSGGGPFVNYTFYDEPSRRIYMVDGSIFAPRVEKKKLILQVDALLHTFRTGRELSEEERREFGYAAADR